MICRLWRGLTRPEEADHYVEHLRQQTLPRLRELPGFVDVSILRRQLDRGAEFVVITRWGSGSRSPRNSPREDRRSIDTEHRSPGCGGGGLSGWVPAYWLSPRDSHLGELVEVTKSVRSRK